MCGIAGLISDKKVDQAVLRRMTDRISHRGPDDEGAWIDQEAGVGLGHRRLSIIDLSPLGHQPMASNDGRWVICYNGEIYNHAEIRAELDEDSRGPRSNGVPWRGHSDTETLVEAIAAWGLETALAKSVGMFALALWDRKERELHLVRDRFGEKPLYYGWAAGSFVFASELKAIRSVEGFGNEVDRRAVKLLAARTYIPAPLSIYKGIFKLPPGCILTARADAARRPLGDPPAPGTRSGAIEIRRYWSYRDVVAGGLSDPIESEEEALYQLELALAAAIGGQSVADVPVGAFLSGGIDSSTVVGLYQKYSSRPVRTFSIGFEEAGFNEAEYAKQVAAHFGAEHYERYVTVKETQEVIPLLPAMYDEPFADSSQIPTHLVSRFAREQVTVALSGDGGDELFGGYNRYFGTARLWRQFKRLPGPVRRGAGSAFGALPTGLWNGAARLLPGARRPKHFGTKVQKTFRTMSRADSLEGVFDSFLDEWAGERSPALNGVGLPEQCRFDLDAGEGAADATRMMYCDAMSYLPDDILAKVDRASMAVSLETRVPFLDHRVAAVAARIPERMKIKGGSGKEILKTLLYREAPRELFERPKAGFGVPVGEWIKGPLRPWAEELLDPARMKAEGYFDPAIVQKRWQQHLKGQSDSTPALWAVLMFQAWHREQTAAAAA
jgi:asparagine synthase (glutamine-hydrolysing)